MAGTHRKPRRSLVAIARTLAKGTALLAATTAVTAAVTVPIGLATHSVPPAELHEVTATETAYVTKTPVNWTEQTCHALEAWQGHQTADRLDRLVVNAAHLPKSYLKADVFELAADAASPSKNAAQYLSVAIQYADEDCWGGA